MTVHERFGVSAHPIDLAVADPHRPGRLLVAVEADGPGYAAIPSTRDRDRLRVEQLRRLGWRHVRVWTTDLFRDPVRDVARVVAAVSDATPQQDAAPAPAADHGASAADPGAPAADLAAPAPAVAATRAPDDSDVGWGEVADGGVDRDRWLQEQRPPHWG